MYERLIVFQIQLKFLKNIKTVILISFWKQFGLTIDNFDRFKKLKSCVPFRDCILVVNKNFFRLKIKTVIFSTANRFGVLSCLYNNTLLEFWNNNFLDFETNYSSILEFTQPILKNLQIKLWPRLFCFQIRFHNNLPLIHLPTYRFLWWEKKCSVFRCLNGKSKCAEP